MTAIHRVNPEIWVETPKGGGLVYFLIDYGPSINSIWVVRLDATGEVIHVDSSDVRILGNPMWGIPHPKPFPRPDAACAGKDCKTQPAPAVG